MTIGESTMTGEGNPFRQAVYLLGLVLIIFGVRPIAYPRRILAVPLAFVVALVWCWLSLIWAIDPGIAVRRLVLTTLVIWAIFVAVQQLGYEQTLRVLRVALVLTLVANFATVLVNPAIGIHQVGDSLDAGLAGSWRGIVMHKNFAGLTCAVTIIVFLLDARQIQVATRLVVLAATGFFMFETHSRTSWVACVAALAIGIVFQRYNARYRAVLLPLLTATLVAIGAAMTLYDPLDDSSSSNHVLTGRPEIWDMLLRYSADNRLLGSGFGSFWDIGDVSPVFHYGRGWVTLLGVGHSGFLDMLVSVGLPGLLLVTFAAFVWPIARLLRHPEAAGPRGALIIALIVFCLAHNVTESSLFDRDAIGQVFLTVLVAMLLTVTTPMRPRRAAPNSFPTSSRDRAAQLLLEYHPTDERTVAHAPGSGTFPIRAPN